ncbi:MAG TPA: hypothetical protein VFI31_04125, partial [Pirellulales bacterium]|nr:hypothetical protein [Pirellulales bacterium]
MAALLVASPCAAAEPSPPLAGDPYEPASMGPQLPPASPPDPNRPPITLKEIDAEQWKAIKSYDEKLKKTPKDVTSLSYRAEALFLVGEHDRALADAASVIRLLPEDPRPYLNRAFMWQLRGQLTKAV